MVLGPEIGPVWIGRLVDAGAAKFTTYLTAEQVVPFPEDLVQRPDTHPAVFIADWLGKAESTNKQIGYESGVYYFSPAMLDNFKNGLPNAQWCDANLLVNWQRFIKSQAELEIM